MSTTQSEKEIHKSMAALLKDTYYKSIVDAHKEDIVKRTKAMASDIMYQFEKGYISKREALNLLESEKRKTYMIDNIIRDFAANIRKAN